MSYWLIKDHEISFTSPFGKGGGRGILRTNTTFCDLENLPSPLFAKEGYFRGNDIGKLCSRAI